MKRGKEGYLYSNFDSIRDPITRLRAIIDTVNWYEKWPEAYSQLIRPVNTWTRFNSHEAELLDMGKRYNFILGYCPRHNIIETDVEPAIIEQRLIEAREQKEDGRRTVTDVQRHFQGNDRRGVWHSPRQEDHAALAPREWNRIRILFVADLMN